MAVTVNASTSSGLVWSSDLSGAIQLQTNGTTVASTATNGDFAFNSGYGSAAVAYACRAWCYFNASQAIVSSANFSSVTVIANPGDIWLNFTTSMVDANYCAVVSTNEDGGAAKFANVTTPATNRIRVVTFNLAGTKVNNAYNYCAVFR